MKKAKVKMRKPVYFGMSILDNSKGLMYEFWYDYVKTKYQNNAKLYFMNTYSFVIQIKTGDFYKDIEDDVEKWFDTSSYNEDDKRLLPIGRNKKEIRFCKDKFGGTIMIEFIALRAKTYAYLMDDDKEKKKAKGTKKCATKKLLKLIDRKNCQHNNKIILKSQQGFKSDYHNVNTEQINKIALSSNDDKRLQAFDKNYYISIWNKCIKSM